MQNSWLGIGFMLLVLVLGFATGWKSLGNATQRRAVLLALGSLAVCVVVFCVVVIMGSMEWTAPLFAALCVILPVAEYYGVMSSAPDDDEDEIRPKSGVTQREVHLETLRSADVPRAAVKGASVSKASMPAPSEPIVQAPKPEAAEFFQQDFKTIATGVLMQKPHEKTDGKGAHAAKGDDIPTWNSVRLDPEAAESASHARAQAAAASASKPHGSMSDDWSSAETALLSPRPFTVEGEKLVASNTGQAESASEEYITIDEQGAMVVPSEYEDRSAVPSENAFDQQAKATAAEAAIEAATEIEVAPTTADEPAFELQSELQPELISEPPAASEPPTTPELKPTPAPTPESAPTHEPAPMPEYEPRQEPAPAPTPEPERPLPPATKPLRTDRSGYGFQTKGSLIPLPATPAPKEEAKPEPKPVVSGADAATKYESLRTKAALLKQKGAPSMAARLYQEAATLAPTATAARQTRFDELACLVRAGENAQALELAAELRRSRVLTRLERLQLDAVERMG